MPAARGAAGGGGREEVGGGAWRGGALRVAGARGRAAPSSTARRARTCSGRPEACGWAGAPRLPWLCPRPRPRPAPQARRSRGRRGGRGRGPRPGACGSAAARGAARRAPPQAARRAAVPHWRACAACPPPAAGGRRRVGHGWPRWGGGGDVLRRGRGGRGGRGGQRGAGPGGGRVRAPGRAHSPRPVPAMPQPRRAGKAAGGAKFPGGSRRDRAAQEPGRARRSFLFAVQLCCQPGVR
jgi:hypothetical protein